MMLVVTSTQKVPTKENENYEQIYLAWTNGQDAMVTDLENLVATTTETVFTTRNPTPTPPRNVSTPSG